MTQNLYTHYDNIAQYKIARQEVLESIKNNQSQLNYINQTEKTDTEVKSTQGQKTPSNTSTI